MATIVRRLAPTLVLLLPVAPSVLLAQAAASPVAHAPSAPSHAGPVWSYEGQSGPAHWGRLDAAFATCQQGQAQSPIDLSVAVPGDAHAPTTRYRSGPGEILNTGETIQVRVAPGSALVLNGVEYELLQFHFHHPSEHVVNGRHHALEIHFVHRNAAGQLAVLGTFVREGEHNAGFAPLIDQAPAATGPAVPLAAPTPARLSRWASAG